ncbi:MAG: reverse transcriptase N-terminal domain-containing protein, partial [Eubacterium sp.]
MNGQPCAASDTNGNWFDIDFKSAENSVKKLQKRIYMAYSNNDIDKVNYLQHRIIHSFYAKALAIKIVTSNRGAYTPGVDNIIWTTPEEKYNAIFTLSRRGYTPKALKKVYIPKLDGSNRIISIPTIKDRAMQTLYKFALEPIAEATADSCSFGFRKGKSSRDAVVRCKNILTELPNRQYVLKTDIKSCFDNISHSSIMNTI